MRKNIPLYIAIILVFGAGIYFILRLGSALEHRPATTTLATQQSQKPMSISNGMDKYFSRNFAEPLSVLLLQIVVIITVARLMGSLFQKIGQPAVIGEMVAGILLGPSFLGLLAPGIQNFVFPQASFGALRLLSQIGVILFMFGVGIELEVQQLKKKADTAVLVSHASIVVPFFLGVLLSLFIYRSLAPANTSFIAFALFIGIAMSITAFPVLARILKERGLSRSYLGSAAIACSAVDDVTAWCILAVVVAIATTDGIAGSLFTICLTFLFVFSMLRIVRPAMGRMFASENVDDSSGKKTVAGILVFVFLSALTTEVIGIHALFGAFLAGVAMPMRKGIRLFLKERLETFASVFLLPLFFAFSGLRTQLDLLSDWQSWFVCLGLISIAVVGKLGGSSLAARWTGMSWRDSLSLGALMNTRGLIELIVLNIGYDMGILSHKIFAMMILMALTTTLMAGPLLSFFQLKDKEQAPELLQT